MQGGLFANTIQTEGNFYLANGQVAGRKAINLSNGTQINGAALNSSIDALGVRETFQTTTADDFYDLSLAGNSGRVAMVPLNTGEDFLRWARNERHVLSPQKFSRYANGGVRCKIRIRIMEMQDAGVDNTPTWVRFYFRRNGSTNWINFKRSDGTWPVPGVTGGDLIPFQTELLPIGRTSLAIYPERFPAYLASIAAEDVTSNSSIIIYADGDRSAVQGTSIPSLENDFAVVMRECEDLSAFTSGFSLVTDSRLYFAGSFNQVSIPIPANSGLPVDFEFFPPTSLFASETRYGIHSFERAVDFDGQVGSLRTDETRAFRPLDYRSGDDQVVDATQINANLKGLISPAQLPPISIMNWMVTVEEIE